MAAPGKRITDRRHPEWAAHHQRWRWLLDSYEGGDRYRYATYGNDSRGLPIRNLVRHKREYPQDQAADAGTLFREHGPNPAVAATDDDYTLRLARTPVPTFVAEAAGDNVSAIYAREVERTGPAELEAWWEDVDGRGTPIDRWMEETVAPLLYTLGCLDVLIDHPAAPKGEVIATKADAQRLGVTRAVARAVYPEDVVWWRLDPATGGYLEAMVREWHPSDADEDQLEERLRHWTATESVLYGVRGDKVSETPHGFGRVPMVRVFDKRRPRCEHVGLSRLEGTAERQREYYNRDSELILSDTTQAHPLLQGPEDYVQPDGTVPVGPGWLLPKKKSMTGGSVEYEGFEVVEFGKGGAESIRQNKQDLRDQVDREAKLAKPAGSTAVGGEGAGVVAQSGLSKSYDHAARARLLASLAQTFAEAEKRAARLALVVLTDSPEPETDGVEITYPALFDVMDPAELATGLGQLQRVVEGAGALPKTEADLIGQLVRALMPGRTDDVYAACDREIEAEVKKRSVLLDDLANGPMDETNAQRVPPKQQPRRGTDHVPGSSRS